MSRRNVAVLLVLAFLLTLAINVTTADSAPRSTVAAQLRALNARVTCLERAVYGIPVTRGDLRADPWLRVCRNIRINGPR